jgi:ferredoxin-NADP reductase/predicted pyridoxine 5'-phosphate oxidase superfamily flavin-nucleotide-binding protein
MMGHKFAEIAFTKAVKQVQSEQKSRAGYARWENSVDVNYLLSKQEASFITTRDSFYMASVSETNWPYVQHRGGPEGFLKVIDEKTIGFADYSGNRQYISTGNFRNNDRVSLFLMDYPSKSRLKILGRISIVNGDNSQALAPLKSKDSSAPIERGFIIHIEGFDWNCPKYITPRYTEAQIKNVIDPIQKENAELKTILTQQAQSEISTNIAEKNSENINEKVLGHGPLQLVISGIRQLTPRVRAFELKDPKGNELPKVTAGSHLQVPVKLADGKVALRHYSICSNPQRRDIYEIAVLNEPEGTGGSKAIFQQYQLGLVIGCQLPENYFQLQVQQHNAGAKAILIAGGIGITPIKAMAQSLQVNNMPFTLHYAGKSSEEMAFSDRLKRALGDAITLYSAKENQRINIREILSEAAKDDVFYLCGPNRLIDGFIDEAKRLNISLERLHFERFTTAINDNAKPITVTLKQSGKTIKVEAEQTILDAMLAADIPAIYSCKTGECRTCAVKVLAGDPLHFDNALSKVEQEDQQLMCPCISRAKTADLTLDI